MNNGNIMLVFTLSLLFGRADSLLSHSYRDDGKDDSDDDGKTHKHMRACVHTHTQKEYLSSFILSL